MKRQRDSFLTPLVVEVMESGKRFRLHHEFTYEWERIRITVPVGFVTDFASIPRVARVIIPKLGRWTKASVVHDYIYQNHIIKTMDSVSYLLRRKDADRCFRDGMRDLGVVRWKRVLMWMAVRIGGYWAWKEHK